MDMERGHHSPTSDNLLIRSGTDMVVPLPAVPVDRHSPLRTRLALCEPKGLLKEHRVKLLHALDGTHFPSALVWQVQ